MDGGGEVSDRENKTRSDAAVEDRIMIPWRLREWRVARAGSLIYGCATRDSGVVGHRLNGSHAVIHSYRH